MRSLFRALFLGIVLAGVAASAQTPAWQTQALAVITSELSPAVMAHTTRNRLTLFGSLERWGLGAPSHLARMTPKGAETIHVAPGGSLTFSGRSLAAPWMLVWFQGAKGWTHWDSPWLVVWQRRPDTVTLDASGLHASASSALGYVALLPLYGLYKPDTRAWEGKTLPAEVIHRCRFWARALRNYPLACDEAFRIDPKTDSVVLRARFRWLTTRDDWNTPPLKLAPLSPTLALAYQGKRMPMALSASQAAPLVDPGLFTAYGPYMGVENADAYEVRFPILHYITQTEQEPAPDTSNPTVAAALARLQKAMTETFSSPDGLFHQDFGDPPGFADPPPQKSDGGNTCWALMSAQYYCRALPYLPADLVAKARPRLHRYFADWVLQPARYKPFRGKLLLVGPGIGTWGGYDDAGKFSSNTILTLWTYARYTGDWALIKARWPLIKQLFITPRECTWRGFGRDAIAEMGDEAAPALAMARLAWFVGDKETFGYAAYLFARELAHHVVKHTGAGYFVARQPIHSAEKMPPNVYLTNLWGDIAGWQIDGPTYPRQTGERQYTNRWVRFGDPDVARFHRDHLQDLDRAELDGLLASGRFTTQREGTKDDPHILPSMVRLRSLLRNEAPDRLAQITPVEAPVHSNSGVAAYCMAFLRVSRPVRYAALFPVSEAATQWARGIERDRPEDEPVLDVTVQWTVGKAERPGAPVLTWWGWKPPQTAADLPGGDRWSFGQIESDRLIASAQARRLS